MKIRVIDRIVLFILATISLFFGVCAVLQLFGIDLMLMLGISQALGEISQMALTIALAVALALVSLYLYSISLRRKRKPAPFIQMESGNKGSIRMAMTSISGLVEQTCRKLSGISNLKVSVVNHEDSVSIDLSFQAEMEKSIPDLSAQIQQIVGEVVERNCGVAVRNVGVTIIGFSPARSNQVALPPIKPKEERRGWRRKDKRQQVVPEPAIDPLSETGEDEQQSTIRLEPEAVSSELDMPGDDSAPGETVEIDEVDATSVAEGGKVEPLASEPASDTWDQSCAESDSQSDSAPTDEGGADDMEEPDTQEERE